MRLVVDQDDQSSLVWAVGTPTIIGGRAHLRELGGSRGAEPGKSFTKRRAGWGREAEKRKSRAAAAVTHRSKEERKTRAAAAVTHRREERESRAAAAVTHRRE